MSLVLKPPLPRLRRGHPLTNGLVFAAPFYEGSGNKAHDISGRDNNGTLTNMDPNTDWVGSPYGWALDFDGSDDFIFLGNNNSEFLTFLRAPKKTAACWLLRTSGTTAASGNGFNWTNTRRALSIGGGSNWNVLYRSTGASTLDSGIAITLGEWAHVAVVVSGSNIEIYVNGVLANSASNHCDSTTEAMTASRVLIGAVSTGVASEINYWPGMIGDTILFDRALSASEIAELYSNPAVIYEPPKKIFLFSSSAPTQTLTPDAAVVDWVANDATIAAGAVTLTPDAADVDWVSNDATIVAGAATLAPTAAVVNWTANDATVSAGGTTITTDPAVVDWTANDATIPGGTQILTPDAAVVEWEAVGATLLTQDCPILKGCSLSLFTYSIEAGIQNPEGSGCQLLSGCTDDFFTHSIE